MNKKSLTDRKGFLSKRGFDLVSTDHGVNCPLLEFFGKTSIINPAQDQTPKEFKHVSFRRRYVGKQSKKV